jgi:hypothetical protein
MTDIAKPNNKLILIAMLVISFVLGIALQRYFLQQEITISYISQSELMELEKARLQAQDLSNRQLFLGEPEKAIKIIEELQAKRTNKHNIVLISEKTIYGKGLKSISQEVHSEILNSLKVSKNNE